MKLFVSSSSIKHHKIHHILLKLIESGFYNIELSGGSNYYKGLKSDIISLQNQYDLNLLIHNYFPPPEKHFVLNLASLNNEIYAKTIDHYLSAIDLSKSVGADCFSIHAGFLIDPSVEEIGADISFLQHNMKEKSIERFCCGYNLIKKEAGHIKIYIENNVLNTKNYQTFKINPFLLTTANDYFELKKKIDFYLLLDLAHLKVSCTTLGIHLESEFAKLAPLSNYWHISDNNGIFDSNSAFSKNGNIINIIKKYSADIITLEIYDDINTIKGCYHLLSDIYPS